MTELGAAVEVAITVDLLERVLSTVTSDAVLVGGQALALWVSIYEISVQSPVLVGAISDDADFIGGRSDVVAIAKAVAGVPIYPATKAITSLVGQVKIRRSPTTFVNVDVLHKLVGLDVASVRERAAEATLGSVSFLVMHPLDVLCSRIENLAQLKDKQNPQGIEQAKLALQVARICIEELASTEGNQRLALDAIEYVVRMGTSGAGRRVAKNYGIDFRESIPGYAISSDAFRTTRWPQILKMLAPRPKPSRTQLENLDSSP